MECCVQNVFFSFVFFFNSQQIMVLENPPEQLQTLWMTEKI